MSNDGTKIFMYTTFGSTAQLYFLEINATDGSLLAAIDKPSFTTSSPVVGLIADDSVVHGFVADDSSAVLYLNYRISDGLHDIDINVFSVNIYDVSAVSEHIKVFGQVFASDSIYLSFIQNLVTTCYDFSGQSYSLPTELGHTYADSSLTVTNDGSSTLNGYSGYASGTLLYEEQSDCMKDNIVYFTDDETINISAGKSFAVTPDLTCSIPFLASTYTLSDYGGVPVPQWISIDSSTGVVSGTSP